MQRIHEPYHHSGSCRFVFPDDVFGTPLVVSPGQVICQGQLTTLPKVEPAERGPLIGTKICPLGFRQSNEKVPHPDVQTLPSHCSGTVSQSVRRLSDWQTCNFAACSTRLLQELKSQGAPGLLTVADGLILGASWRAWSGYDDVIQKTPSSYPPVSTRSPLGTQRTVWSGHEYRNSRRRLRASVSGSECSPPPRPRRDSS